MAAALFAFLAAAFAGIGARDQILVAGLTARNGRGWAVLAAALCVTWLSSFAVVWAAGTIAGELNNRAGLLLAALALALGALELAILAPRKAPQEPTRSLGAAAIVLLATQITDATRFLIFAIAIAAEAPRQALLGGALGSMLVVAAGWLGGEDLLELKLKPVRRVLAALLALVAGWLVFQVAMR
jgi:Ca2+/H+ antiporter, TMEM165/GDT1 family